MPTRFIHSRSSLIPSLVMFPFIQCHQTRGFALSGGFRKPLSSVSPTVCPGTRATRQTVNTESSETSFTKFQVLRMNHLALSFVKTGFFGSRELPTDPRLLIRLSLYFSRAFKAVLI